MGLSDDNTNPADLIKNFFGLLQEYKPDFTNTFRLLNQAIESESHQNELIKALGNQPHSKQWVSDWLNCIKQQHVDLAAIKTKMHQVNPAYIPRNHLVENAINAFIEDNDSTLMDTLLGVLKNPFQQQENTENLQCLPSPHERVYQTFCGT